MLTTSTNYKTAIEQTSREFECKFILNGKSYTKKDIISFEVEEGLGGEKQLPLGGGYINSAAVKIKSIVEGLQEMMPCSLEVSVKKQDGNFESVKLGSFFVVDIKLDRNSDYTELKIENGFCRLDGAYTSSLSLPTTSRAVLQEITTLTGIRVKTGIAVGNDTITVIPKKITYREAIVYIAQMNGAFAVFNRDGELDFAKLRQTGKHINKDMYKPGGLVRGEIPYRFRGIENKLEEDKKTISAGTLDGTELKLTNPWMTQTILDRVFNQLRDLNYYPYTLDWRGDPALEVGDWITAVWGDNVEIDIPIISQKLSFDGGLSAECSAEGKTQTQTAYQYKGGLQKKIEYIEELVTSQGLMFMDTEEPNNPKNGDIWFKPSGGYVELWEYEGDAWVKKADTADVNEIVDTISTDAFLAKKISAAIANVIELNAKRITAGDMDLQRLRIVDGDKEVMVVRDGKLVINFGSVINDSVVEELSKPEIQAQFKGDPGTPAIQWTISEDGYWIKDGVKTSDKAVGTDGADGTNGVSITSMTPEYYLSASSDSATGGAWSETPPPYESGKYIWIRYKISKSDGSTAYTFEKYDAALTQANEVAIHAQTTAEQAITEITEVAASIQQTATDITLSVVQDYAKTSDLEQYKTEVQNFFILDSEGVNVEFKRLSELITQYGTELKEQKRWIRLIDGKIHIGEGGNPISTVYDNDSLDFLYNGNVVATFTNDLLFVRNLEVENQVKIAGHYAWRPGAHIESVGANNLTLVWIP